MSMYVSIWCPRGHLWVRRKAQEETEVADPHSQTFITHRCEKVCCLVEASGAGAGALEQIHRASAVWPKSTWFSFRMLRILLLPFSLLNYKTLQPLDSWAVASDPSHLIWMSLRDLVTLLLALSALKSEPQSITTSSILSASTLNPFPSPRMCQVPGSQDTEKLRQALEKELKGHFC